MLMFLLFLDQILGGQRSLKVGGLLKGGAPCGRKPAFSTKKSKNPYEK